MLLLRRLLLFLLLALPFLSQSRSLYQILSTEHDGLAHVGSFDQARNLRVHYYL